MTTRTIAIRLQYDGHAYLGFQRQAKGPTIQGAIEKAILELSGEPSLVTGSGRTDAGVHALGQVISFRTGSSIPPDRWAAAINTKLPGDISALASCLAPDGFNARFDALSKAYRYVILPGSGSVPLMGNYAWVTKECPDLGLMRASAALLEGTHDFSAFRSAGSSEANPVRTISRFSVEEVTLEHIGERAIIATVSSNGFLYKMVRNMMGTLVEASLKGAGACSFVEAVLRGKDRKLAPPPAPGSGLYLLEVGYPQKMF